MAKRVSGSEQQANSRQHGAPRYLEFTERSPGTYLVINKRRRRLLYGREVIRLSVIVPFFNVERYPGAFGHRPGRTAQLGGCPVRMGWDL